MRFKVENIEEISDSRQVMESKPNKFTSIFIYILLIAVCSFLTWSWFSEKEIVVKASGIIKPNEQTYTVSNQIGGEVKEVQMKNGQDIKKGDVLYTIDSTELQNQKAKIEEQKKYVDKNTENLVKLNKSIEENINYFSDTEDEKEFYYKYKSYEAGNKVSLEDKNSLIGNKEELQSKINGLNELNKSIDTNENYTKENSVYREQFNNYQISKKAIEDKINQLEKSKEDIKIINRAVGESIPIEENNTQTEEEKRKELEAQIEKEKLEIEKQKAQIDIEIENNKNSLLKLKSDIKLQIQNSLDELKSQIKGIDSNINKGDEGINVSKEKNKTSLIAQIEEQKNANNEKLKEIEIGLKEVNENIEKCEVKAESAGKLDIKAELQTGIMIQTGTIVANILPSENEYKVELVISDKDIANIKEEQEIKYNFQGLPHNEYGFSKGKIENISVDSKVDSERGLVFYTGEGSLKENILYSNKGEASEIKAGMTCEARVITRKQKMLYYFLEKLNLKN